MSKMNLKNLLSASVLGLMVCATSAMAKEIEVVNISKIAGMPWFNRMGEGVEKAGKDLGIKAYQVGPSSTDAPQQVKIIEDLIAKKVSAISIVPNDADVLEPVFKKARAQGIVVLTNESPGQPSANWDVEIIDNEKFAADNVEEMAKAMGGKGGYVIYVGGLTVPQHNLWADLFVKYQKAHYPDMYEVTSRMPVAENIDDARRTTLDLMKAHPDMKGVVAFGSQGPIGAGRAVKEKRARGKVFVFGMMIPSQAASLVKSGDITMGVTYDPGTAGYALAAVANKILKGEEITKDLEIPNLGKADVDMDKRIIKFHNVLRVTKDNVDSLY
ncbi:autoinducer 2 ABC transporter substrate-binding protein [Leminorella grimontii]|uniref:Autoinducer 2 ABC transporter substrate-binding protein n=2 Tax=Leminorella grimontii TaxID=82981 RepID=A0AAV5MXI1_9GAMM|nr:autoinducer 2 ABC transporter substrate-binding protein [Leminorella grimontii]KFC95412.1 periplasmic substrate-binding component of an ABC superfamily ribose/xylose/arabinose/galactoside transporter [Leminorella grimontii ATCC 33999 = DSM 5078]GKX54020.1 autoinducer 2 ABC transporter substrate-binding protein [Leminorella grimontii]GKX60212.1 autoinducer 2 ABC transporter substrate-binding protein [Leminorella grimontii]VFS60275.1 Autoinducer 2-binding protein lsrB precursor [Leminorella gr